MYVLVNVCSHGCMWILFVCLHVREKLGLMYIHMFGNNRSHMLIGSQKCKTEMSACWRLPYKNEN